ncbi:hypothetical protein BP6252_05160 [Coleophoma cylindrospora]|uniref:RING-type domain-containing protein n=1 Tax=Coleophoma cylindrospora TaxID=1849047 RepID=A0A3D8RSP6_9HELO|nr:hypothetical protein BP6252_05160 [Coleophoma cylindrospora]
MRPPRIIIVVAFVVTSIFLTILSIRSSSTPQTITTSSPSNSGLQGFLSFRAPFSLFPPNAIITLTHENSTAFLARPAAFGPPLPIDGLKGQLWIGSGFGDDGIRQGMVAAGAEGELGCSDVPGWVDSFAKSGAATSDGVKPGDVKSATTSGKSKINKRDAEDDPSATDRTAVPEGRSRVKGTVQQPSMDDGTDDYLHHPLPGSSVSKPNDKQATDSKSDHADIQSIQEGAEIAGKVVLLSRGGCGFLEKVKWAQRRGGIALIVGDDTKGGALIQMYARGDTSNVTIPAIFTSRTTAHLLSSLIGPGSFIEDSIDENGKPTLKVQHSDKLRKAGKKQNSNPTFTPTAQAHKPTATVKAASNKKAAPKKEANTPASAPKQSTGWFKSIFSSSNQGSTKSDSSRPPSSGQLDWVLVDEWKDDDAVPKKNAPPKQANKKPSTNQKTPQKAKGSGKSDDFVIGVQDWRDPDLVGHPTGKEADAKSVAKKGDGKVNPSKEKSSAPAPKQGMHHTGGALQDIPEYHLKGGSITPGSGEYNAKDGQANENSKGNQNHQESTSEGSASKGLLAAIFGDDDEDAGLVVTPKPNNGGASPEAVSGQGAADDGSDEDGDYDGLWVTLTPTSGASPFLDTLLVLVVSPLVTLTIVYSLLLIRSRIRRRRWRAPKSVVERLPVRTYQTIASGTQSPRVPSPTSSSSANTPLLQSTSSRPRPRSRTTTGIPEPGDLIRVNSQPLIVPAVPSRSQGHEHEKNASVSSEWKKFMGKQVECVVCLEEYIDGVSRVMSLPCGHEFHEDCITPWLTTRRRTCPICKGDVVRSLARGSPSSPRYEPYRDDSDDDIQIQAAETVNNSPSAAQPIPRTVDEETQRDLEQGLATPTPRRPRSRQSGSWRSMLASSLGSSSRSPRPSQEDRTR